MSELKEITSRIMEAENRLAQTEKLYGKTSQEYKQLLSEFAAAWFSLRSRRDKQEFL